MGLLSNPKVLYFSRIWEAVISLAWIILAAWCGTHRSWWTNINGALALGVISTIFTLLVVAHALWSYHRSNPFSGQGSKFVTGRIIVEVIMVLVWIGTAGLMLRHKGCKNNICLDTYLPPIAQWDVATAFAFVEIISFIATTLLVIKEDRTTKSTGGTNYV